MDELIKKISSYNLFNYLLPGVIFVAILDKISKYHIFFDNLIFSLFIYYFIGLVVSRIGSLIIEPLFKKTSFVKFADYSKYILASKNDSNISLLLEANNMYRTFISLFLILFIVKLYEFIEIKLTITQEMNYYILIIIMVVLFSFSYKKQVDYIRNRVENFNKQ